MVQDLSRCSGNGVDFPIKVLDIHGDSSECLKKRYLLYDHEISSSALEQRVTFNFDADVDVTSNDARLNQLTSTY